MIREAKSPDGFNALFEAVYPDLKKIAKSRIASFSQAADLQATEVVNKLFIQMREVLQRESVTFSDRKKFFAYASTVAFHDILRSRKLAERFLELEDQQCETTDDATVTLTVRRILELLGNRYPRAVKSLYLKEVIALSLDEVAQVMDYNSINTLRSDLVMIRKKFREAIAAENNRSGER